MGAYDPLLLDPLEGDKEPFRTLKSLNRVPLVLALVGLGAPLAPWPPAKWEPFTVDFFI